MKNHLFQRQNRKQYLVGPALAGLCLALVATTFIHPMQATEAADGKSFEEIYRLALKRAESIAIQDELLIQANELKNQATAALLPTISGAAILLEQQAPSSAVGSTISPSSQSTVRLSAVQPLFRGFRDFAALRQRKEQITNQQFARQNAARQLFYDTATAYYNTLALRSDVFNYETALEVYRKRLSELEGFLRIGRSQITDVLTLRSALSSLDATLELARGQLENSKEVLAFFSGLPRDAAITDQQSVPQSTEKIETYLSRIEQRPDIKTALSAVEVSEEGIPIARGQHLPSVDLLGNYYLARASQALRDVNWDVSLALTFPIFQGGAIVSQTRQAASAARQANLVLSQTRRIAEQEIRQFYDNFAADQKLIARLTETAELARRNYEAQVKEFRNGLVRNLDVLTALTNWQDAKRVVSRQQLVARLDYVKLQAASANRPEIFLEGEPGEPSSAGSSKGDSK